MITGTNADCRILGVSVSGSTATVSLLVFATASTYPAKAFSFAIIDEGSNAKQYVSNDVYWIDKNNNYDHDSRNIDTNKYKEIILTIDITNGYESPIEDRKWVRRCAIAMVDQTDSNETVCWSSGNLTLVSEPFDAPDISNLGLMDVERSYFPAVGRHMAKIGVGFGLRYATKRDFKYDSANVKAFVTVKSAFTGNTIESKEAVIGDDMKCLVVTDGYYDYGAPVVIEISIVDLKGKVQSTVRKICRLYRKRSDTYVKTRDGIRKAIFNNATVKKPAVFFPEIRYTREEETVNGNAVDVVTITVEPNISDPFFTSFEFEILINGEIREYMNEGSELTIRIADEEELQKSSFTVQIRGRYFGRNGYEYRFEKETKTLRYYYVCSDETVCSEKTMVRDMLDGYFDGNAFYGTYSLLGDVPSFSGMLPIISGARYFDVLSDGTYVYNEGNESFVRIL